MGALSFTVMRSLPALLAEAVRRGIVSADQADALQLLHDEQPVAGPEAPAGFNAVNVAYGIGALLVLFASGWFLVERWSALGPLGVLGVVLVYAVILFFVGRWLAREGFVRAAGIAWMLAVSLTPLVAWSVLRLTGEWPAEGDALGESVFRYDRVYAGTRLLVLDLSTLLVALVLWRQRRFPALAIPLAVASWWAWFHLSQLGEFGFGAASYQRWVMLAAGFGLLATADAVERWQRATGLMHREGDYAGPYWYLGTVAAAGAYMALWVNVDAWKHMLPIAAAASLAVSLLTGRRVLAFAGVLGIFGYLAYLAGEVFKTGAMFPLILAALGILTVVATVWLQRRFKGLAGAWTGQWYRSTAPTLQRRILPWVPMAIALVIAFNNLGLAPAERAKQAEVEREFLLRQHQEAQDRVREQKRTADSAARPR